MKAVVVEVKDGISAVLKEDGTVEKLNRECEVGEIVEINESAKILSFPKFAKMRSFRVIAASLVAAIMIFAGTFHYSNTVKACSFVSIDVNPSLEYALNRKDRVVSAGALNEEAQPLVDRLNREGKLKGKTLTEALTLVTSYLKEMGYLEGDEGQRDMLVSVTSDNDEISDRLEKTVHDALESDAEAALHVEVKKATMEEHKRAAEYGISAGRLVKAIEEKGTINTEGTKTADAEISLSAEEIEKVKTSSVAELMTPAAEVPAEPVPEAPAAPAEVPAQPAEQPADPAKQEAEKKKEEKKKKEKEKKEKEKKEKEKKAEEEKEKEKEKEKTTETPSTEEKKTEVTEPSTEVVPETEATTGQSIQVTEDTSAPSETESESTSTEAAEPEMTEEEKAAAEAEEVRRQQEIQAQEEAAEAEAVRQQQELEAAEGVVIQNNNEIAE